MTLPVLSWSEMLLSWRMRRQRLAGPGDALVEVVEGRCGLQPQLPSAELALWALVDGLRRRALLEALWADRTLAKLWAMRATLHLLPRRALGTWLLALSALERYGPIARERFDELAELVGRAFDGRILTRGELGGEVRRLSGSRDVTGQLRESWGR